ncbi:uncharacterized protein [Epargyreus clarus]|uniref:uncharacterized protein n=1 Tax=Epargyreus clarus TaxID=520877 RepID=UPI003C2CCA2A
MYVVLDAGIRIPRGVLNGNLVDLGNYYQCLGIDEEVEDMRIEGKYCFIQVPADQDLHWPEFREQSRWFDPNELKLDEETQKKIQYYNTIMSNARTAAGFEDERSGAIDAFSGMVFRLAVCIPKPCTTEQAIASLLFNVSAVEFKFNEEFCRLPNDKPWVAVDTVAAVVFSLIGFLTLLSTCYDLNHTLVLKRDLKTANTICTSFSLYTNTHRLLTFKRSRGTLECLDGIRVLAMMWVILGHSFTMFDFTYNMMDVWSWMTGFDGLWVTTAPITVDTFFTISGVLLVYTTVGRFNGYQLLKRLHLFYLHRLVRMFPILAAIVLLEASFFHRIADGPYWDTVARNTQRCRTFWWTTLLHIQNWANPLNLCLPQSWYIAIDIQLYIVSPIVLFWVLNGNKKLAWTALIGGLLAIFTASTIFNFIMKLPAGTIAFSRMSEMGNFRMHYYFNTLTRASPFFMGMVLGYILHLCRGKRVKINPIVVLMLWIFALALFATPFYTTYLIVQLDWDNQAVDSSINSFQRSIWALALGWLIFACVQGYGGPINWFLSLPMWKLPSRLSYAMYLYHFSQIFITGGMQLTPNYFSVPSMTFNFLTQFTLTFIVAFVLAIVIEAPFSMLFKTMLESGMKKPKASTENGTMEKNNAKTIDYFLIVLDAGIRTPRGVLNSNLVDLGNYYQCLGIDEEVENMKVEGKYCVIQVPADQDLHWPEFREQSRWFERTDLTLDEESRKKIEYYNEILSSARTAAGFEDVRSGPIEAFSGAVFRLAVCIPKPCTTHQAIASLLFNVSAVGFKFNEEFCRLPSDKPWVAADTVAVVVFSLIGLLTLLSTCYDLNHTLILKRDPKTANMICTSFSLYTNTHRLLTFKSSKGTLECLDGIRVLAMMWVILGHTFTMYNFTYNMVDVGSWMMGVDGLWVTTAPISVDTFFMIAGVLLVYTTAGKLNGYQLLNRLHLFYLNRLLRMFPALGALVLLEASFFHRIADGPYWDTVARNAQRCRTYWWSTLLHIQNWVNPMHMCIPHTWYIAMDIQLYIVSPIVLFWVLNGNKKFAWTALIGGLLAILTGSTIFNFIMKLPAGTVAFSRFMEIGDFLIHYYFNTLTRGSPFFVGMVFGYILHLCRGKRVKIHLILVLLLWIIALALFATPFYTTYLIVQPNWDNQAVDSSINSFQRSIWALALGWLIFACVQGYGGPINWFLSLPMWKLPSRLSYAMYLYHFSQMFITADMQLTPNYFSVPSMIFDFLSQLTLTLIVSFVVAIVIEAPFSLLFKTLLESGQKKPKALTENGTVEKNDTKS